MPPKVYVETSVIGAYFEDKKMIKDSPIVEDIRRIRKKISEKFDHDIDRYIAYLQSEAAARQAKKAAQTSDSNEDHITDVENQEQSHKEAKTN